MTQFEILENAQQQIAKSKTIIEQLDNKIAQLKRGERQLQQAVLGIETFRYQRPTVDTLFYADFNIKIKQNVEQLITKELTLLQHEKQVEESRIYNIKLKYS